MGSADQIICLDRSLYTLRQRVQKIQEDIEDEDIEEDEGIEDDEETKEQINDGIILWLLIKWMDLHRNSPYKGIEHSAKI